ncbi:MAG: ATP-binding protein, partial [Gammaproteobacteria bacterium]
MIPYAGPPGHFRRISYHQVLSGDFTPGTFRDKYVLVGATAVGLGDALPTPVSGNNEPMSGVEINANILDSLYRGIDLQPVGRVWVLVFSGLFALLPFFLFHRFLPRTNLLITAALILATLLFSSVLLLFNHLWLPPTAATIALMLSFPLWNSRRLGRTMVLLGQELERFEEQKANLRSQKLTPVDSALEFVTKIFALKGWCITDTHGAVLKSFGNCPVPDDVHVTQGKWTRHGDVLAARTRIESMDATIYLHLRSSEQPTLEEQEILDQLLLHYTERRHPESRGRAEIVLARVEQVQDAATQLRAVYRFIDNSLGQMADGILVTDRFGRVILSNKQALNLLALPATEELKGQLITDLLAPLTHQENTSWNALIKRVLIDNRPEVTNVRHGADRDLMVHINPLSQEDHTLGGIIVTLSDISELKNSERRRNEALSFLSHDLRSPMVSLLALLELAKSKDPSGEQQELIRRMETYTERTIQLSEQFLHLARAESEEDIEFYDVNLVDVIDNAMEEVWATASARKISIAQDIELLDAWIKGDAGLLERAFINLLTNAIKYSPEDRTITVHLSLTGSEYRCCVDDQGFGVPEDELPALFNHFKRGAAPAHRKQKGTGLGLALVKAVAERHHGHVEVTSTAGAGSCFCMILPAAGAS